MFAVSIIENAGIAVSFGDAQVFIPRVCEGLGVHRFFVVESEGREQSEHGERDKREQNGEEQAERFDFHAARPDADRMAGGEFGADKSAVITRVGALFDVVFARVAEGFTCIVFVDTSGLFKVLDLLFAAGEEHVSVSGRQKIADAFQVGIGKCSPVFDGNGIIADE